MIKIEIKNRFTGSIIFEYSKENNTIKETLLQAIKDGADLRSADLRSADLYGADLRSADLRSADLRSANLYGADLRSADLRSANLRSANLYGADLRSADLYGADLPIFCKWSISFKIPNIIRIGCKEKSIDEWNNFFYESKEEYSTKRDTKEFHLIQGCFEAYKNFLTFYNK